MKSTLISHVWTNTWTWLPFKAILQTASHPPSRCAGTWMSGADECRVIDYAGHSHWEMTTTTDKPPWHKMALGCKSFGGSNTKPLEALTISSDEVVQDRVTLTRDLEHTSLQSVISVPEEIPKCHKITISVCDNRLIRPQCQICPQLLSNQSELGIKSSA